MELNVSAPTGYNTYQYNKTVSSDTFPPPLPFVFIYLTKMQIEASKE